MTKHERIQKGSNIRAKTSRNAGGKGEAYTTLKMILENAQMTTKSVLIDSNNVLQTAKHQSRQRSTFRVMLSDLEEDAEEGGEDGQAELGDDELEVTEESDDGNLETREEDTGDLDDSDDDRAEELTVYRSCIRFCVRRCNTRNITYPTWNRRALIATAVATGWAERRERTAARAVKTS